MMDLMSLSQVASELGLTRQRVHVLAARGILKTVQAMGRQAVRRRELDRFRAVDRPSGRPLGSKDKVKRKQRRIPLSS